MSCYAFPKSFAQMYYVPPFKLNVKKQRSEVHPSSFLAVLSDNIPTTVVLR